MHETYLKWIKDGKPKIICNCDCKQEIIITKGHKQRGIPKYMPGHQNRGKNHPMLGRKFDKSSYTCMCKIGELNPAKRPEVRKKISEKLIGRVPTVKTLKKLSDKHKGLLSGDKHPNWQGGITPLNEIIKHSNEYKEWRLQVFGRDNFTCQHCGIRGTYLEVHHIKRFSEIIKEYNIKNLEDALNCELLWYIDNGITYCLSCHDKLKKKGGLLL